MGISSPISPPRIRETSRDKGLLLCGLVFYAGRIACSSKMGVLNRSTGPTGPLVNNTYMMISENSVPLKPMVNDHYPY